MYILKEFSYKTTVWLVSLAILLFLWMYFFSKTDWLNSNKQYYCKSKEYSIWKAFHSKVMYLCRNSSADNCLDWLIRSNYLDEDWNLFINFTPSNFVNKDTVATSSMLSGNGFSYSLSLSNWGKYTAKSPEEIIRYWKLSNDCSLSFYSENSIKQTSENEQAIFNKLKTQKFLIVNGVDIDNLNP